MLQLRTILPLTLELLRKIQDLPCAKETRLVGGTALALQYGHRQSVDLDFFGSLEDADEQIPPLLFDLPDWEQIKYSIQRSLDEFR